MLFRSLTDPVCGLLMGQTAENLAHRFGISRQRMDEFSARSHARVIASQAAGVFNNAHDGLQAEIEPLFDAKGALYKDDDGVRADSTAANLAKLRPFFDRKYGNVTAGNSSQITDGGALVLLATEEAASSGRLSLFGHDLRSVTPNTLRAIRRLIGYIPQDLQLISDLSVYDNVALALTLGGKALLGAEAKQKINRQIEVLGLGAKKNSPVRELSGGEAQQIGRAHV